MGQILSQPVTEKHSEKNNDKHLAYGLSCMQGWRINMEDAHATILDIYNLPKLKSNDSESEAESDDEKPIDKSEINEANSNEVNSNEHISFFGVYDGHGGERAALFTGDHLHHILKSTESFQKKDYINALKEAFLSCDQAILQDDDMKDDDSGCAATSAIITPSKIICGNAGDSRTIMSINGFAKALSYDHKPSNEGEKARISNAGGYVEMGRVNGNLALSRGIGDFEFKKNIDLPAEEQIVTCYPDVIQHDIDYEKDEFIVLACDGIWDCLTSQSCVECVRRGIFEEKPFTQICEEIMELCCAPTSEGSGIGCDNMSIVIVALLDVSKNETLDDWYKKINNKIKIEQEESKKSSDQEQSAEKLNNKQEFGPISAPYNDLYKEMFGDNYEIGQQSSGSNSRNSSSAPNYSSMFGGIPGTRNNEGSSSYDELNYDQSDQLQEIDGKEDDDTDSNDQTANGAISLQKLLASNAITNENGVIYLDTSSAQSLLAHFGMSGVEDDDGFEEHIHEGHDHHEKHHEDDKTEKLEEINDDDEEEEDAKN